MHAHLNGEKQPLTFITVVVTLDKELGLNSLLKVIVSVKVMLLLSYSTHQ